MARRSRRRRRPTTRPAHAGGLRRTRTRNARRTSTSSSRRSTSGSDALDPRDLREPVHQHQRCRRRRDRRSVSSSGPTAADGDALNLFEACCRSYGETRGRDPGLLARPEPRALRRRASPHRGHRRVPAASPGPPQPHRGVIRRAAPRPDAEDPRGRPPRHPPRGHRRRSPRSTRRRSRTRSSRLPSSSANPELQHCRVRDSRTTSSCAAASVPSSSTRRPSRAEHRRSSALMSATGPVAGSPRGSARRRRVPTAAHQLTTVPVRDGLEAARQRVAGAADGRHSR